MIDEQQLIRTVLAEQGKVLAYIQSIVRQPDLADDIFQDVCALAVQKRAQVQDEQHLQKWLMTTSRLEALAAMRKRRREHLLLDERVLDALDRSWEAQGEPDLSMRAEALRKCLLLLSASHRSLVTKRFVEGYDYTRLAAESHRAVDSLYVTFSRIYAFLAKCISDGVSTVSEVRRG